MVCFRLYDTKLLHAKEPPSKHRKRFTDAYYASSLVHGVPTKKITWHLPRRESLRQTADVPDQRERRRYRPQQVNKTGMNGSTIS